MTLKTKTLLATMMVVMLTVGIFAGNLIRGQESTTAFANTTNEQNLVSVQGEGVIRVNPDVAYLSLGVETSHKDMHTAQNTNREKMNGIVSELERLGIKKEDIQTQNFNVNPDYQWKDDKNVLVGYRVTNLVRIKVTKLDDAGKLLDAAAAKGANIVHGIQFTVSDSDRYYHEALKLAMKNAEAKAKTMVGYFGLSKLTPVTITEGVQSVYYPTTGYEKAEMMDRATPISPWEMEVRAQISVSFKY